MFRKIFFILAGLLFLASPVMATDYYIDMNCANNGDGTWDAGGGGCDDEPDGSGAWNNLRTALNDVTTFTAGDKIWVRRTSVYDEGVVGADGDIRLQDDGTASAPLYLIGWPRASEAITSATWTNGSTTVDIILPATMDITEEGTRFVTGPDGFDYVITAVTDGNTIIIDRPYAGATVTLLNGAATIKADVDWAIRPAEAQATWDGDDLSLSIMDFNDEAYQLHSYRASHWVIRNFHLKDSNDTTGIWYINNCHSTVIENCYFTQAASAQYGIYLASPGTSISNIIIDNSGGGGTGLATLNHILDISNSAIYACSSGILIYSPIYANNLNIGVEIANTSADLEIVYAAPFLGRDVYLGGTNGYITDNTYMERPSVIIANWDKVLGSYRQYFTESDYIEKVAVTGVTPNKKLSDNVIEYTPTTTNKWQSKEIESKFKVWESRKTYDAGTHNIKVWIYNNSGAALNDTAPKASEHILMRCRAEAGSYDATNPDSSLLSKITIAFTDDDPDTITDSDDGFVAAGFQINDKIRVEGSTSNDGEYTIAGVAVGVLTLIAADTLTAEIAGDTVSIIELPTKYVSGPWIYSDEIDILDAADADDWDYLQCDNVVVDVSGSKIYCEILVSYYDADADPVYIDPESSNP